MTMWYKKPFSATLEAWSEWREETKANYPIQYFFRETVTSFFRGWLYTLNRFWWAIMHRVHPKHRYNIVKPRTLPPAYYPTDVRIRHAAFDLMSEYAETLMGDGIKGTKWTEEDIPETDDEGRQITLDQIDKEAEIIELRNWWVDYYPRRDAYDVVGERPPAPEGAGEFWSLSGDRWAHTPEYEAHKKYLEEIWKIEKVFDLEDEQKFIELVKLLPHMYD